MFSKCSAGPLSETRTSWRELLWKQGILPHKAMVPERVNTASLFMVIAFNGI